MEFPDDQAVEQHGSGQEEQVGEQHAEGYIKSVRQGDTQPAGTLHQVRVEREEGDIAVHRAQVAGRCIPVFDDREVLRRIPSGENIQHKNVTEVEPAVNVPLVGRVGQEIPGGIIRRQQPAQPGDNEGDQDSVPEPVLFRVDRKQPFV